LDFRSGHDYLAREIAPVHVRTVGLSEEMYGSSFK
jgi:hypothetical protein